MCTFRCIRTPVQVRYRIRVACQGGDIDGIYSVGRVQYLRHVPYLNSLVIRAGGESSLGWIEFYLVDFVLMSSTMQISIYCIAE